MVCANTLLLLISRLLKDLPSVITRPSIPSSETSRLDPEPTKKAGRLFSVEYFKIDLRSSLSLGVIYALAGPPIPYEVCFDIGSSNNTFPLIKFSIFLNFKLIF